jgi:hypothetical protein
MFNMNFSQYKKKWHPSITQTINTDYPTHPLPDHGMVDGILSGKMKSWVNKITQAP